MDQQSALLSVRSLTRTYGSPPGDVVALGGVDPAIGRGELTAIMGPSGSGKSTLLTIIGGLEEPGSGTVEFDGRDLWSLGPAELAVLRRRHGRSGGHRSRSGDPG